MKKLFALLFLVICNNGFTQDKTNVSLYLRKDPHTLLKEINSKSGNLFHRLGHHGPAVENQWFGLRIYFNKKAAIDLYSKSRPGLELESTGWYSTKEQQKSGWGADYYRVGKSVGLGGIKLWNGKKVVPLNPVSKRSAKVAKGGGWQFNHGNDLGRDPLQRTKGQYIGEGYRLSRFPHGKSRSHFANRRSGAVRYRNKLSQGGVNPQIGKLSGYLGNPSRRCGC